MSKKKKDQPSDQEIAEYIKQIHENSVTWVQAIDAGLKAGCSIGTGIIIIGGAHILVNLAEGWFKSDSGINNIRSSDLF